MVLVAALAFGAASCQSSSESATETSESALATPAADAVESGVVPPAAETPEAPAVEGATSDGGGGFVETFDAGTGLERFDTGIYHRDEIMMATMEWSADHDHDCGDPGTQRTIHRDEVPDSFYMCRDHVMTSIGDTAGYSTGWFSPQQVFTTETQVSWDVNVTNLLARKWWEVAIIPTSFDSGVPSCPHCSVIEWLSPDPSGLPPTPEGAIVVGNGPFGNDVNISYNGSRYTDGRHTCGQPGDLFEANGGCASKAMRLPFSITELDGQITVDYGGVYTETFPGTFPDEFVVVFKDHNYTPNKDGEPVGQTWHWDSVSIT